jgi:membrane protein YdbS with pleckstrin-like domain
MAPDERWLRLHPLAKPCWIIKGFFASLIIPLFIFFGLILEFGYSFIFFYFIVLVIINIIIISWALLFYDRYRYQFGKKTLNINRGILWKKDATIPYERIQHVSITRGPVEQLLGLYIINVFTAGTASVGGGFGSFGSAGMFAAEGYIPGVINPEEIRKKIMKRVKDSKSGAGLGDVEVKPSSEKHRITKSEESEIVSELKKIRKILERKRSEK